MEDLTEKAVRIFINTLQAQSYDVFLDYGGVEKDKPKIRLNYSPEQLLKAIGYMKKMNMDNYHIYCRPEGLQYILLDDIRPQKLKMLAKSKPCLLIETSPNNFQAWLKLKDCPTTYETALNITRTLQIQLDADKAAVSPKQVGRLPGYTNRKPKYMNEKGQFPFVKIRKWANRFAVFTLSGGACPFNKGVGYTKLVGNNTGNIETKGSNFLPSNTSMSNIGKSKSQSEIDFGIACRMIRAGNEDWQIRNELQQNLAGRKKGKHYINKTIENARKAVFKTNGH